VATAQDARRQLSSDIGDDTDGRLFLTTTGAGTTTSVVSDEFLDFDADEIKSRVTTIKITETGHAADGQERTVSSIAGSTATVSRGYSSGIGAGIKFELHRVFTAGEKDNAITKALDLVFPRLFVPAKHEFVIVQDQFDYDISAGGFYRNIPRTVALVSASDTEVESPVYAWDTVPDTRKLRLEVRLPTGRTIRCIGHKKPVLADISAQELGIVTARAGMYLMQQAILATPGKMMDRYTDGFQLLAALYQQRVQDHAPTPVPLQHRTTVWDDRILDYDFSVP